MTHKDWMRVALKEAEIACSEGEVPVGAVIVKDGAIVAAAHNRCEQQHDPTAHAEFLAMRQAYGSLGSLSGCTLYVTLEPCVFCAGAMVRFRLPRLVYGAFDRAAGCCGSRLDLTDHWFEHSVETIGGILASDCEALLQSFFSSLRKS